jgi:hypothetical protein
MPIPNGIVPRPLGSCFNRPPARLTPAPFGQVRCDLDQVSYSVELSQPADTRLDARLSFPPLLLESTAPDSALPKLVLEWTRWARGSGLPPWELAERGREFVVSHYVYTSSFSTIRSCVSWPELR